MKTLVANFVFPIALVTAFAFLIRGYEMVGDGFSAAMLASVAALLQYFGASASVARRRTAARFAHVFVPTGLLLTVGVTLAPMLGGAPPVSHGPPPGAHVVHFGSLPVHTAFFFDCGVACVVYGGLLLTFDRVFPAWKDGRS